MSAGTDASLWLRERRAQRRAEVLQQNQKSQTHQDHLRGAASVKAHFVPLYTWCSVSCVQYSTVEVEREWTNPRVSGVANRIDRRLDLIED